MSQRTPITIPITFVHGMLQGVRARGDSGDQYLSDAHIDPELLGQEHARVTVDQYVALFKSLVERLDDEVLGFMSRPARRGSFALIARSAIGAPTLEVALRRLARTYCLLQDDVVLETVRMESLAGFGLHFQDPHRRWPDFLHELLLRVFWRLLAWLAGGRLPVIRFDFAFPRPSYVDSYDRIFPSRLNFDTDHSTFWFDAKRLQQPLRQDEKSLLTFLADAQSNIILPRRNVDSIGAGVRSHLQQTLPQWSDVIKAAEALHMSSATLQRRLSAEGTSFQALKDALRRDMAIVRLNSSTVPLATLACELGFSDSAAFQRAFKRWTGSAPGSYRRSETS